MSEITRKIVLIECLEIQRQKWKMCSRKYDTLEPMKGMEQQWNEQKAKCELLEDLIHAYESPPVRKALVDWQKEIMKEDAAGNPHQLNI